MGLTSAYAAGMRAKSKVLLGAVVVKMLTFSPTTGGLADDGQVRSFDLTKSGLGSGAEDFVLTVAEDATATAAKLRNCQFAIGGIIYKVGSRTEPISLTDRRWRFSIEPTGDSFP